MRGGIGTDRLRNADRSPGAFHQPHLAALDGWRGLAILCVMMGHMLPVGPARWGGNAAVAATGMALFFGLSGFLIVTSLLRDDAVVPFIIKRLFRILPLAWLYALIVVGGQGASWSVLSRYILFVANDSEATLAYAPHFWSLSVEMQFYGFVALLVAIGGRRALWVLPVLAIGVTAARIGRHMVLGVETLDRIDEIMAGGTLALACARQWHPPAWAARPGVILTLLAVLTLGMTTPMLVHGPVIAYVRPYLAALLIGLSLRMPQGRFCAILTGPVLRYVARISYALYVLHPLTYAGWMGSGDVRVRYTKRMVSLLLAFGGAHLSTFHFERPLTRLGQRIARRTERASADRDGEMVGTA